MALSRMLPELWRYYVGYYQRRHGLIPISELAPLIEAPTHEQVADFAEGMRCLAAALTWANAVRSGATAKPRPEPDLTRIFE
jgi:Ribonuclease G/E